MVVSKVNDHAVVNSLCTLQRWVCRQLLDIHHVSKTKEGIDVNTRLQIFRKSEGVFYELDGVGLDNTLVGFGHLVDLGDHKTQQPQSVRGDEHLLLNIHHDDLLSEFNHKVDGLSNIIQLEEVLFLLQVEKDLTHDYSQRKVEHLVIEFLHPKLEILTQNFLEEIYEVFDFDEVDKMVLKVLAAVKDGHQEVLEHGKVAGVQETDYLDQGEQQGFEAAVHHLAFVALKVDVHGFLVAGG